VHRGYKVGETLGKYNAKDVPKNIDGAMKNKNGLN
jgi:hypothetical protein